MSTVVTSFAMSSALRAALIVCVCMLGLPVSSLATGAGAAPLPTLALDACSWDRPGVNPFMGDVVAAVDRYRDIAPEVRERLKTRMAKREYDDIVSIRRDSIEGRAGRDYGTTIRDMHFGTRQLCRSVTRASWSPAMQERGLVYCESGSCILVPTVCRNVSRITRREVSPERVDAVDALPLLVDAGPVGDDVATLDAAPGFVSPVDGIGPIGSGAAPGAAGAPGNWASFTSASGAGGAASVGSMGGGAGSGGGGGPSSPLSIGSSNDAPAITPVPEPQTWVLCAVGLLALVVRSRALRRR